MKAKTHFIALLMLAMLFASCQSTRVQKDAKTDALITAAKDNNVAEARRFIADGADVNATDSNGNTALIFVTKENSVDVARLLLAAGADADVNAKDIVDLFRLLAEGAELSMTPIGIVSASNYRQHL